jgi:hypothetical protein
MPDPVTVRNSRPTFYLPDLLQNRLNAYALAAGAAGVGMFNAAPLAEARIIYTPAHHTVSLGHPLALDLNHDGKIDFTFNDTLMVKIGSESSIVTLFAHPARNGNGIAAAGGTAYALPAGVWVGRQRTFLSTKQRMAWDTFVPGHDTSGSCSGRWSNVKNRYLGLKFTVNGKTHFGWARMNVTCGHATVTGLLTGYAYETIPRKEILTGKTKDLSEDNSAEASSPADGTLSSVKPATLGMLATEASRLSLRWQKHHEPGTPAEQK